MAKKVKVRCLDCMHWDRIDIASGLCKLMVKKGIAQPVTGETMNCEKAEAKQPLALLTTPFFVEPPEAPC